MVAIVARTRILEAYGSQLSLDPDADRACAAVALIFGLDEETVRDVAALMYPPQQFLPTTPGSIES